ncbi:5'-3' exoribonuclease [Chlamydiales bacterium SCGC AG-110-M15]|nr:5'-3' exoribonuclease [Chlamydiales bacterium SCGC AG-110-M15]
MNKLEFRADLHCHSTCSDGTCSPKELVDMAVEAKLSALAITDHDNIDAFHIAKAHAEKMSLPLIPGVEISASHQDTNIHILGYAYDSSSPILKDFCDERREKRLERFLNYIRLLQKEGLDFSVEEALQMVEESESEGQRSWGRAHIAQVMLEKGFVTSIKQAFDVYIGDKSRCYIGAQYPSVEEAIKLIHDSGGLAVLAHPHFIKRDRIVREVLEMNFDGLECFYARIPREQEEKWCRIAEKKSWIATGGSDFHGSVKPHIFLGASWVNEEIFQKLHQHYLAHAKRIEN